MKNPLPCLLLTGLTCCALSGCITIGPRVEIRTVILKPGQPVRILENKTVRAEPMTGETGASSVDVGGWIAMPPEHWDAIKPILERAAQE